MYTEEAQNRDVQGGSDRRKGSMMWSDMVWVCRKWCGATGSEVEWQKNRVFKPSSL